MKKSFSFFLAITFILLKSNISYNSLEEGNKTLFTCLKLRQRAPFMNLHCEKLLDKSGMLNNNNTEVVTFAKMKISNDILDSEIKEVIALPQKDITNSTRKVIPFINKIY